MKRLRVHVPVEGLVQPVRFNSTLFAAQPSVMKPGYAKSEKAWCGASQGLAWETFLTNGESSVYGDSAGLAAIRTTGGQEAAT